jgi:hypothetical protein
VELGTAPGWPESSHDPGSLEEFKRRFLLRSGEPIGALRQVCRKEHDLLRIELISDEAVKTSEIGGEILDRASVQSSLRH